MPGWPSNAEQQLHPTNRSFAADKGCASMQPAARGTGRSNRSPCSLWHHMTQEQRQLQDGRGSMGQQWDRWQAAGQGAKSPTHLQPQPCLPPPPVGLSAASPHRRHNSRPSRSRSPMRRGSNR